MTMQEILKEISDSIFYNDTKCEVRLDKDHEKRISIWFTHWHVRYTYNNTFITIQENFSDEVKRDKVDLIKSVIAGETFLKENH